MQLCTSEAFLRAKMRHLELQLLLCSSGAALASAQLVLNATRASMHGFERSLFCYISWFGSVSKRLRRPRFDRLLELREMPICFAHKRILQLRREIFFVRHEGVHARFWTRSFLNGSLYSKHFRITCKTAHQSLVISLNPVPLPVACCRSAFCSAVAK